MEIHTPEKMPTVVKWIANIEERSTFSQIMENIFRIESSIKPNERFQPGVLNLDDL